MIANDGDPPESRRDGTLDAAADGRLVAGPEKWMQRAGVLCLLPGVLGELGVDPASVLTSAGLPPDALSRPDKWIPFLSAAQVLREASARTRCPHIGLLTARRFTIAQLGVLGELMLNSATAGDALRSYVVHNRLYSQGFAPYLFDYGDLAHFGPAIYHPLAVELSVVHDLLLAAFATAMRELLGAGWCPVEAHLPRHRPVDVGPYREHFRCKLRFDAERAALVFPSVDLGQRIAGADPRRLRKLEAEAGTSMDENLLPLLYRSLRLLLLQGNPSATLLAQQFSMHERTLARRLRARGTSFQAILDDVRFEAARNLLLDTRLDVTRIGSSLGYADGSAFSTAFRRWSGESPRQWRSRVKEDPDRKKRDGQ